MSSIDYAELAGLHIALSRHALVDISYKDEGWVAVDGWLKGRIKELERRK